MGLTWRLKDAAAQFGCWRNRGRMSHADHPEALNAASLRLNARQNGVWLAYWPPWGKQNAK